MWFDISFTLCLRPFTRGGQKQQGRKEVIHRDTLFMSFPLCHIGNRAIFNSLHVFFCPSVQKSDHGQVLLDAVFKHLELTERDYFGLHLADDSLDTPVSVVSYLQESLCVGVVWVLCVGAVCLGVLSTMIFFYVAFSQ